MGFPWRKQEFPFRSDPKDGDIHTAPQLSWYLVAQTVKNLPSMQETWVWSPGQEDSWRREWLPTPIILPREFHGLQYMGWKELDTVKWLTHTRIHIYIWAYIYLFMYMTHIFIHICFRVLYYIYGFFKLRNHSNSPYRQSIHNKQDVCLPSPFSRYERLTSQCTGYWRA